MLIQAKLKHVNSRIFTTLISGGKFKNLDFDRLKIVGIDWNWYKYFENLIKSTMIILCKLFTVYTTNHAMNSFSLTLFAVGLKIYLRGGGVCHPSLNTQNHCENPSQKNFCFSDRSYRNGKSNEIWGYLEAILRVLELIFGKGGCWTPPTSNRVKKHRSRSSQSEILDDFLGGRFGAVIRAQRKLILCYCNIIK